MVTILHFIKKTKIGFFRLFKKAKSFQKGMGSSRFGCLAADHRVVYNRLPTFFQKGRPFLKGHSKGWLPSPFLG